MTVDDANKTVLHLIGEQDYQNAKDSFIAFYDVAQRQIATTVCPIIRRVALTEGVSVLPQDLFRIKSVDATYTREGDNIITDGKGTYTLTYYAYPKALTDGSSQFEIDPEAQSALPFYAAAQAVIADSDMRRYNAFLDSYDNVLANIAAAAKQGTLRVVRL